jgi:hypothetical protein
VFWITSTFLERIVLAIQCYTVIDTNVGTSQFTAILNVMKVTAYVKPPALRLILAENHVTKMLKSSSSPS